MPIFQPSFFPFSLSRFLHTGLALYAGGIPALTSLFFLFLFWTLSRMRGAVDTLDLGWLESVATTADRFKVEETAVCISLCCQ